MKKILALLLALVMLSTLTACGKDEEGTPTGESTGATTNTTGSTNDPTDGTQGTTGGEATESTEPSATTPPATTTPTTIPPTTTSPATTPSATETAHTHKYNSNVTTAATCNKDGVQTYTCSCGDTYTKKVAATGHSWKEWKTIEEPTVSKNGKAQRECANCSETESKKLDKISLPFSDMLSGGNALAVSCLSAGGMTVEGMLNFCSYEIFHSYIYEHALTPLSGKHKITVAQQDFYFTQYAVPEDVVISIIMDNFLLMEDFWYDTLRASDRYDSNTQTFRCTEPVWFTGIDATVLAYEHLGGDDYQLYLESRITNHPNAPCSECATTNSCVLNRTKLSVLICARPGSSPIIISYGVVNSIPDSATRLN